MTLHRTCPLEIFLKAPSSKPGHDRAFAFELELALGGESSDVDPESGMLINLVQVDAILAKVKQLWLQRSTLISLQEVLMESMQLVLAESTSKISLQRLCFYEKRGWYFGWEHGLFRGQRTLLETVAGIFSIDTTSVWSGLDAELEQVSQLITGTVERWSGKELAQKVLELNPSLLSVRVEHCVSREVWRVNA
jgi:hypothetical protein